MTKRFEVTRTSFKTLHELENAWTTQQYKDLLTLMDYDQIASVAPAELKDLCLMSLTDLTPEEAAALVLGYIFKDRLNKGQIANLSNEILEEKLWEEYADVALHEEFFNVHQLLYNAFDKDFPLPTAVLFKVSITEIDPKGLAILDQYPEASIIRLLLDGMPKNTIINRLFHSQLEKKDFEEAKDIIWQYHIDKTTPNGVTVTITSSEYWFHDFKYITSFEGSTHFF